jgi:hypothetical protein
MGDSLNLRIPPPAPTIKKGPGAGRHGDPGLIYRVVHRRHGTRASSTDPSIK